MSKIDCGEHGKEGILKDLKDLDLFPKSDPKTNSGDNDGCQADDPDVRYVDCDTECHVRQQVMTAIRAATYLLWAYRVRADNDAILSGIDGIANGAAVEIIRTLGKEPRFINLRKPPWGDNLPEHALVF